jgi:hypothetical protein
MPNPVQSMRPVQRAEAVTRPASLSLSAETAVATPRPDARTRLNRTILETLMEVSIFNRGFQEATDILRGSGELDGPLATAIGPTQDLVVKGYADFAAARTPA